MSRLMTTLHSPSNSPDGKLFLVIKTLSADGDHVTTEHGAVGSTLTLIARTQSTVTEKEADTIVAALVKKKLKSTYTIGPGSDNCEERTSLLTSLTLAQQQPFTAPLYPIDDPTDLLNDDKFGLQQKIDGERRPVHASKNGVLAYGRHGQQKSMPKRMSLTLATTEADFDGEIIDNDLFIFDITALAGADLSSAPFATRYDLLKRVYADRVSGNPGIYLVPLVTGTEAKTARLKALSEAGAEGVVFKHLQGKYVRAMKATKRGQVQFKYTLLPFSSPPRQRTRGVSEFQY